LLAGCATALVLGVWWQGTRPNQPLFLQMTPSVVNYVVARVVGAANMNDTTLEILPTGLAVLATAALLVRRPRISSSSLA
jgi:hypothetical protein